MTPAEFDTRRRFLGLSVEETAALCGVADRTVRRWQAGTTPVPTDAAEALEALEHVMHKAVERAVERARERRRGHPVRLIRYRGPEALAGSPEACDMPPGAHAMMIGWTAVALRDAGFEARIVWSTDIS